MLIEDRASGEAQWKLADPRLLRAEAARKAAAAAAAAEAKRAVFLRCKSGVHAVANKSHLKNSNERAKQILQSSFITHKGEISKGIPHRQTSRVIPTEADAARAAAAARDAARARVPPEDMFPSPFS